MRLYGIIGDFGGPENIEWENVHLFWGDERCVPPDDKMSNYGSAISYLISKGNIPADNIHRIRGELGPEDGARDYEMRLREFFNDSLLPEFDVILLGLGEDAHTASLFPGSEALREDEHWVTGVRRDSGPDRITLTIPSINNANTIIFIVTGIEKAEAVSDVFFKTPDPEIYPAQAIKPAKGNVYWVLDRDAASVYLQRSSKA